MQKNSNTQENLEKKREGQIIKRGKSYLVRVYLHRDVNGKRIYYNATIKGTRKDAQDHLTEYLQKKNVGKLKQRPSDKRFGEFIEDYFTNISTAKRRNREIDLGKAKLYIVPALGHFKLKDLKAVHIEQFYKDLRNGISKRTNKPLSGTTRNNIHRILVNAVKYALNRRLIIENPLEGINAPKPDSKEMNTLSPCEAAKFLQVSDNYRLKRDDALCNRIGCMFHLAIETGLRPEEYFALQWKDLDFGNQELGISATLRVRRVAIRIANKNQWWFDEPKTARSRRSVPLSGELVRRLKEHRINVEKWKRETANWNDNDLVFPNNQGDPHYPDSIRKVFKKTLELAEIDSKRYRLYDLRHTCASLLLLRNVHPKVVSERLGHSSVSITLDVYSHCLPTMQESATENLVSIIYGKKREESLPSMPVDLDLTGNLVIS